MQHAAAALEDCALLDDEGGRLKVPADARRAPQLDALAGDDVAVDGAVDLGGGDLDVGVNLAARADNQRAFLGAYAPREMAVYPEHAFELGVAGDDRAAADEPAHHALAQVAGQRLRLRDGARR